VGWFWYLGTLVPVIGLVQVGTQSIADRYTYVPLIGFFILLVWGGVSFPGNSRYRKYVTVLAVCLLVLAAARSRDQVGYWRNGFTLFEHAIAATAGNHVAHHNLGTLYDELGHYDKALEHYRRSLMFKPLYVHSHYNLGNTFSNMGRYEEATVHYQKALEITPFDTDALYNLGNALYHQGRYDEAVAKYREALRLRPEFKEARENLRWTLIRQGR
jgi:tetratricopeptide (TPR) repeat protein